jgi:RND family efflux transporter MFP subunit
MESAIVRRSSAPRRLFRLLVLAIGALAATQCSKAKTAQALGGEPTAKAIQVEAVRQESVHRVLEVVGTLAAEDEVTVSSQAEGIVRRVVADLGDAVRKDQPLVELDRERLEYSLEQEKAALARALTKYGATDTGHLPTSEETPDVRKAAAELAQAKQAHERAAMLHKRELIPQQNLDDALTVLQGKQASYDSALQSARNLRAEIDVANATLKQADRGLRDATIRAPFNGAVQKRLVSVGELVKVQMPVMTIVRIDPLKVLGEIPERLAPWIKIGQPLVLRVDAYPDRTFNGTVSRISPGVTTATRTFAFEASTPNNQGLLKPGTFVRAHLETALVEQALTIPYTAMQYRYGVNRAFVVKGDKLSAQELTLGDRRDDRMEISGGLKAGDLVALTDVDNLSDGQKVTVGDKPSHASAKTE